MNRKWSKFILVICGIFLVLCIFCNSRCIFYYVQYDPLDETIYMDVVPLHIKLLNSGIVINNNNIEKIVDIKSVKKIKNLIEELSKEVSELEEDYFASNRFMINGKTYSEFSLSNRGKDIISQILELIRI